MKIKPGQPAPDFRSPDLTVEEAYFGSDMEDHLKIEKINQWLDNLP